MLIILSPAKKQDFSGQNHALCEPNFTDKTQALIELLAGQSLSELKSTLNVSDSLAALNFGRYQDILNGQSHSQSALMAYQGDVYRYMERENWSEKSMNFANDTLLIISALYGALQAHTAIQPYRLEMINDIPNLGEKLKLYWQKSVTEYTNELLRTKQSQFLLNLASKEYSEVIDRGRLDVPVVDVDFLEVNKAGKLRVVAVNAKRARGALIGHIVQHQMTELSFSGLNIRGYQFDEQASSANRCVFIKD